MVSSLPPDVMTMICADLASQREFGTLFVLCLAGKQVAGGALWWLYRIHTHASIRGGESNEDEMSRTGAFRETSIAARVAQQKQTVSKWALQWRSIILSSLGKTLYPYCLYIQSLDLRNLVDLLEDYIFRDHFQDMFFSAIPQFGGPQIITRAQSSKGIRNARIDISLVVNAVGESISKYISASVTLPGTTAALDDIDLSGNIDAAAFLRWIRRLTRLKSMTLWDGTVLDRQAGEIIKTHCRSFKCLSIYTCHGDNVDYNLASFITALPMNTLKSLHVFSYNDIGEETVQALNHHRGSLVDLAIGNMKPPAIGALSRLQVFTAIRNLDLVDADGSIGLELTAYEKFIGLVGWVTGCTRLETVRLRKFVDGPAIIKALCLKDKIQLNSITLDGYTLANNQEMHRALAWQTNLEALELRAEAEECTPEDIDVLVSSLSSLKKLRYLNLLGTSDCFQSSHVQLLAVSLPKLEDLSIGGDNMADEIWAPISQLHQLRSLSFHSLTSFSFGGLMNYISSLQQSNYGLHLYIMSATIEGQLNTRELAIIRETLAEKVDGRFEFVLYRELESDFESYSD